MIICDTFYFSSKHRLCVLVMLNNVGVCWNPMYLFPTIYVYRQKKDKLEHSLLYGFDNVMGQKKSLGYLNNDRNKCGI